VDNDQVFELTQTGSHAGDDGDVTAVSKASGFFGVILAKIWGSELHVILLTAAAKTCRPALLMRRSRIRAPENFVK
jgi:hypothetical protein